MPDDVATAAKNANVSAAEVKRVLRAYDKDGDGNLDEAELAAIKADFAAVKQRKAAKKAAREAARARGEALPASAATNDDDDDKDDLHTDRVKHNALEVLRFRYDHDDDGELSDDELHYLVTDVKTTDTFLRYFGYCGMMASHTAKFVKYGRVAFGPTVGKTIVRYSFGISWAYVSGDVAYEAYKARYERCEDAAHVGRGAAQRFLFQSMSSIVMPFCTLKTVMPATRMLLQRYVPRAPAWVPQAVGLSCIPLMPFVWDAPCDYGATAVFDVVWPQQPAQ